MIEQLGSELKYVCTINEAHMGIQIAAISAHYIAQMKARAAVAKTDGTVQVGEKMMENMRAAAAESAEVFGVPKAEVFVSARTPHGDELVMEAHKAARAAIRKAAAHVKVGITLSLHNI